MRWGAPTYAWLLLLVLPATLLAFRTLKKQRQGLATLGEDGAKPHAVFTRGSLLSILSAAAALLIILALCRPQWGIVTEQKMTKGLDIVIALDTSRSMLADDLPPTRLTAAKEAVGQLTARLAGDRIGLIAFAGSAFMTCPLTTDYGIFAAVLAESGTDSIPMGGSSLAGALKEARRAFSGNKGGQKILILISDGEDHGSDYASAVQALRDAGIAVYTVAAGTSRGGLIPLPDGEFLKDRQGAVVKSRLQPAALQEIATAAGGRMLDLTADRSILAALYERELAAMERRELNKTRQRLQERFQFPLAAAIALLLIEPVVGIRRRR